MYKERYLIQKLIDIIDESIILLETLSILDNTKANKL